MSFLELEGLHAFVTGAAGGIGQAIANELLAQGCKVTAHDRRSSPLPPSENLFTVQGDISSEASISGSIKRAREHFGPINILAANAGITDESAQYPLWQMPSELWDRTYNINVRGTFFTIKHILQAAEATQKDSGEELDNLAIVVTGSECGKFGQAGHSEYASGKAALQYGLVRTLKNEIVKLNRRARINAVAPGWVDTPLIEGRLDDPKDMWVEAQATVPLAKIAKPEDVARTVAFLASHRAAGHVSGECLSVDGGMEGRVIWKEDEIIKRRLTAVWTGSDVPRALSPPAMKTTKSAKPLVKVAISVDFDAVSGWLGTGAHPDNNLADFSSGFFSARVGVPRLLKMFKKLGISDKVTWFIPGHSMESFPEQTKAILDTGCELGLHGYCHEGAGQLTESQEREVIEKCIELATNLIGKRPRGYRAPLYQLRENTIKLLEEHGLLYDSSLSHQDCTPYYVPSAPPINPPDFKTRASAKEWMYPLPAPSPPTPKTLVEIPGNWYTEDMTPLQFWPHTENSQGYVDVRVVEQMWKDRYDFIREEAIEKQEEGKEEMTVFPLIIHPDTSGMAHVIGMVRRTLKWLQDQGEEVEFCTLGSIAQEWKDRNPV